VFDGISILTIGIMYGYVCMGMYVWVCMYGYVCMGMYVWVCMYGYVCMGIPITNLALQHVLLIHAYIHL